MQLADAEQSKLVPRISKLRLGFTDDETPHGLAERVPLFKQLLAGDRHSSRPVSESAASHAHENKFPGG